MSGVVESMVKVATEVGPPWVERVLLIGDESLGGLGQFLIDHFLQDDKTVTVPVCTQCTEHEDEDQQDATRQ